MKIAIIIYLAIGVIAMLVLTGLASKGNLERDSYNIKGVKGKLGLTLLVLSTITSNVSIIITWPITITFAAVGLWLTDK